MKPRVFCVWLPSGLLEKSLCLNLLMFNEKCNRLLRFNKSDTPLLTFPVETTSVLLTEWQLHYGVPNNVIFRDRQMCSEGARLPCIKIANDIHSCPQRPGLS